MIWQDFLRQIQPLRLIDARGRRRSEKNRSAFWMACSLTIAWLSLGPMVAPLAGQEDKPAVASAVKGHVDQIDSTSVLDRRQRLGELIEQLRACLLEVRQAEFKYLTGKHEEAEEWHATRQNAIQMGKKIKNEVSDLVYLLILDSPQVDEELLALGKETLKGFFQEYQYERTFQLATRLGELEPSEAIDFIIMRSAMLTNRFEIAANYREKVTGLISQLPQLELSLFRTLPDLIRIASEEEKRYQADAESDLPRVEFETTEGNVVVELFEDQYPETVGHFIHLVEGGLYDSMVFHRITKNFLPYSIVQTGMLTLTEVEGTENKAFFRRDIGYSIYDEAPVDGNVRRHLRGVLSIPVLEDQDKQRQPHSGGSEFLITLVPTPVMDGYQVAFGRVISGMENIDRLEPNLEMSEKDGKETPIEGAKISMIKKATVLRKRDHDYQPNRVKK